MIAIDLLAAALPQKELPEEPLIGICCVSGEETVTIDRKHAILVSFTNFDILRAPMSGRVGVAAWQVMTYTSANKDPAKRDGRPLQQSHWICDGEKIEYLDRQGVRRYVIDGVPFDRWAGYATTSYKKHGSLLAPVNTGCRQSWLWEMRQVDCSDRGQVAETWLRLRDAQDSGIHRPLIESLDIAPGYIGKIGWRVWRDFEQWAKPRHLSPLYQFLNYLLPSKEELKHAD
jgi:hypothetical protein